jgi:hypothetical protein
MNDNPIADMGMGNRTLRADGTVASDLNALTDYRVSADQCTPSDLGVWPNDGEWINGNVIIQLRRWVNHRTLRDATGAEHGSWTERTRVNVARDGDKCLIRPAYPQQHGSFRRVTCKPITGQHSASLGRCQRSEEPGFGNECQISSVGQVDRCDPVEAAGQVRSLGWFGPR